MADPEKLAAALKRVAGPVLGIAERVSEYPRLTDAEIDEKASGALGTRNYDLYPHPFPRDGSILLPTEARDLRNVAETIDKFFPGRTSPTYAFGVLQFAIEQCLSKQARQDWLTELAVALKYLAEFDEEWMFIYPMENLMLKTGKLRVGPVEFHPTTEGDTFLRWRRGETALALGKAAVLLGTKAAPTFLDPTSRCDSWATVKTRGDRLLAEERAFRLVTEAIDIIRLFVAQSDTVAMGGSVNFGLGGQAAGAETNVGFRKCRVNANPTRTRTFQTLKKAQRYGPAATYKAVITSDTLSRMREGGLEALARAVGRTNRSELEGRAFRAFAWFSEAMTSPQEIDRFLKLVFAIDALLGGGPEGEGSTTDIAERAAFLFARTVKGRRATKAQVVGHFRLRGGYAHGSRKTVPWQDLFWAELNCAVLIRKFVVHHMSRQSFVAFLQWVEEEKFSTAD
jgi:hypothetical protein